MDRTKPDAASHTSEVTHAAPAAGDTQAGPVVPPALAGLPHTLGGYRIVRLLGQGGMGAVYHARDEQLGRDLAVKTMRPDLAADPADRERFLREARTAATVEHDNVIAILHVGQDGDTPFIAMPLLRGLPLDKWLRDGVGMPLGVVLKVGREVADGLAAAHAAGLVHRDIKPANVWIEGDPKSADPNAQFRRVKILDFGLARPAADDAHLTHSGAVIGTPAYMSPEQGRGEKVDARTDLWSLGVMLYRLTTGAPPFRGTSTMAVLTSIAVDDPPPPPVSANVPPALSDLIMRLLSKDRNFRPASAAAVAAELRAIGHAAAAAARRVESAELSHSAPTPARAPRPAVGLESNPFADIDLPDPTEADGDANATEVEAAPAREAPPKKSRGALIAVGVLLLTAVGVVAGVMLSRPKKKDAPDAPPAAKGDSPKPAAPAKEPNPERAAADWIVSVGGKFRPGDGAITWVDLSKCQDRVADADLVRLGRLTELKHLDLSDTRVRGPGLAALHAGPKLEYLNLTRTPITDDGLKSLEGLTALTWVEICGTGVTGRGLAAFGRSPNLAKLVLHGNNEFTRAGADAVGTLTAVRELHFGTTPLTDADLPAFYGLKSLRELSLDGTRATSDGVQKLRKALPDCRVVWKDTAESRDRDAAAWAARVGGLVTVRAPGRTLTYRHNPPPADMLAVVQIDLTDMPVGDADLMKNLAGLAHLRKLVLTGTNATAEGARALARALPRCEIKLKDVTIKPSGALPPDPTERQVVEWALGAGSVEIRKAGKERHVTEESPAPAGPFTVVGLNMGPDSEVTDADLARLAALPGLERLTVGGPHVTDAGLKHLGTMKGLTALGVFESPVTDAGAAGLTGLTGLTHLALGHTKVTDAGLRHLAGLTRLTSLHLSGTEVTDAGLEHLRGLTGVEILFLSGTRLTGSGFVHLKGWERLRSVRLDGTKVTDAGVAHLAGRTALAALNLTNTAVTDAGLAHLAGLPALQALELTGTAVTDAGMEHLKGLPKLVALNVQRTKVTAAGAAKVRAAPSEPDVIFDAADDRKAAEWVLSVGGYVYVKEGGAEKFVAKANQLPDGPVVLTWVGLTGGDPKVVEAGLANLAGAAELTRVHLTAAATDAALVHLAGARRLEKLELTGGAVTDAGLGHLAALTDLTDLYLGGTKVTGAGLAKLASARKLASLSFDGCDRFGDADLAAVAAFPKLRYLNLRLTAVSDAGLVHLAKSTELIGLRLTETRVKGPGLAHLKGTDLRVLDVSGGEFDDTGVPHLTALRGLVDVNLSTTRLTGAGFERLKELPNLNWVGAGNTKLTDAALAHLAAVPRLKNLSLSGTGVTDAGVKHLATATGLTHLSLNDTAVTDTALESLAGLTNLAVLGLERTKVTPEGVARLQKALPKCKISTDAKK